MITRLEPSKVRIDGLDERLLRQHLTYIDKSVDFELKKARHSKWLLAQLGDEGFQEHLNALKAKRTQCLLFEDSKGFWTYSGLGQMLADKLGCFYTDKVDYPESKRIPWAKVPDKDPRPYQEQMKELLLEARHGAVEVGTGLGKSFVILLLAKELGLKTVIMTPSVSIAEQIHEEFKTHLGQKYVGQFFDGKKESKKLFTVAVDDSLAKVEPGSEHWKNLSTAEVFIADESHLCPAKSLARVCFGLLANAPYRFFFSGTQMRNDGLDLLLEAITDRIVFRMTVEDGVNQGWLAKPMFRMIPVKSEVEFASQDANEMTRAHLYYEPMINAKAAQLANMFVEQGRQVVILVKELEQISWLDRAWSVLSEMTGEPRNDVRAAHAGSGTEKKKKGKDESQLFLPEKFRTSDPKELVKAFNRGEFPILIGTSCITTGTDIQTVGAIIYLQGGKSEIQVKQAVGRGTRKPKGKEDCYFIDFDVVNGDQVHRHAEERAAIYQSIYPDFEVFPL